MTCIQPTAMLTYTDCKRIAVTGGYKFFALQQLRADGTARCYVSHDGVAAKRHGQPSDCSVVLRDANGRPGGAAMINSLYAID